MKKVRKVSWYGSCYPQPLDSAHHCIWVMTGAFVAADWTFGSQYSLFWAGDGLSFGLGEAYTSLVRGIGGVELVDDGMDHDGLF